MTINRFLSATYYALLIALEYAKDVVKNLVKKIEMYVRMQNL